VELAGVLGLQAEPNAPPQVSDQAALGPTEAEIAALIAQRLAARGARDYAAADAIRDRLRSHGIELIDRPGGSTDWIRK
jgi:cysteinyl-tRNA synthetase